MAAGKISLVAAKIIVSLAAFLIIIIFFLLHITEARWSLPALTNDAEIAITQLKWAQVAMASAVGTLMATALNLALSSSTFTCEPLGKTSMRFFMAILKGLQICVLIINEIWPRVSWEVHIGHVLFLALHIVIECTMLGYEISNSNEDLLVAGGQLIADILALTFCPLAYWQRVKALEAYDKTPIIRLGSTFELRDRQQ